MRRAYRADTNLLSQFQSSNKDANNPQIPSNGRNKMVRMLYIIGMGEFEISIKTAKDKNTEADSQQLISYLNRPSTKREENHGKQNDDNKKQDQNIILPSANTV